jgi:hypothetical protein
VFVYIIHVVTIYGIDAVANEIDKLQYFQKISNLLFGPFAADVEKLPLVCFSFV